MELQLSFLIGLKKCRMHYNSAQETGRNLNDLDLSLLNKKILLLADYRYEKKPHAFSKKYLIKYRPLCYIIHERQDVEILTAFVI